MPTGFWSTREQEPNIILSKKTPLDMFYGQHDKKEMRTPFLRECGNTNYIVIFDGYMKQPASRLVRK